MKMVVKQTVVSKAAIRRLRLQPGDLVVVKTQQMGEILAKSPMPNDTPDFHIIVAPDGILRVNREWLLKKLGVKEAA